MTGRPVAVLACFCLFSLSSLPAGAADGEADGEDFRHLLARLEVVQAELERTRMAADCPPEDPKLPPHFVSLRKNAIVTIGGEVRVAYIGSRSSFGNPGPGESPPLLRRGDSRLGSLEVATARLDLDVRTGDRWRAYVDINLNGYHGFHNIARRTNPNTPGQPVSTEYERRTSVDNINAAYVELLKPGVSGLGLRAGIMELPFGLGDKPDPLGQSFMDAPDLTGSYLASPESWDNAIRLPHASRLLDPATALFLTYELRDIYRFEAALFQEETWRRYATFGSSASRYRGESELPQSWQLGFSFLPLEGWELTTHFRNRHSRSRGVHYWADSPYRWDFRTNAASGSRDPVWDSTLAGWADSGDGPAFGSRSNEQAFVIGVALEVPNTALSVHAQYAHGWNQGFNKHVRSDGVDVGVAYRVTPFLTLLAQGEWLHVKDRSWLAERAGAWHRDTRNHHLYRALVGAEYELAPGLTLEGGWQYEYWRQRSAMAGTGGTRYRQTSTATMVYLGSRLVF
ncbi:MAG: hypothetical protein LIP77_01775 [Planctomycetes bacterium]|nr:hypothetical protein [Planctomycetota bacterium]